jgi:RNA polymerase sigma factor (sigma-70 family)
LSTGSGRVPAEAVERSGRSFDGFYRRHRDRLARALALGIRDADLATDAVDEAMARAAERWGTVGTYDSPEGWVYRVALNWSVSALRRRKLHWLRAPSLVQWDRLPNPEVNRAIARLDADVRAIIVARFYLDWTIEQIATALELPVGTVKSRLSRTLDALARQLGVSRGSD